MKTQGLKIRHSVSLKGLENGCSLAVFNQIHRDIQTIFKGDPALEEARKKALRYTDISTRLHGVECNFEVRWKDGKPRYAVEYRVYDTTSPLSIIEHKKVYSPEEVRAFEGASSRT